MNSLKLSLLFPILFTSQWLFSSTIWDDSDIPDKVDEFFAPLEKHDLFNGSVIIVKGDNILVDKGYGYANYEHKIRNTPDTRFRVASISKIFTKLAIIQLADKSLLSLEDPLAKFIPDYPNAHSITVEHLLNHFSGIPHLNDFDNYDILAKEHYTIRQVIELFKDKPLEFDPGSKESYSNSGYVVLADIIEKISGIKYGDYLREYIFKPAGMEDTGHDSGVEVVENMASGYMMNLEGPGLQKPLYYDPSIKIGGGSIYSTTRDLFAFVQAFNAGKLCQNPKPLYNQGTYGSSPGFQAAIWELDDVFIAVLCNNYNTPIRQVAWELANMMLGKDYKIAAINEDKSPNLTELSNFVGDYKIGDDIETIELNNGVLIEYENGDKWRACRLIPQGGDIFYDTCYSEKLTFLRDDSTGKITGFIWENGDKATRIQNAGN